MKKHDGIIYHQLYQCSICMSLHADCNDAHQCFERGQVKDPKLTVGTFVRIYSGYRWFDGDEAWINMKVRRSRHNTADPWEYTFTWVITAIDWSPEDRHVVRYHLRTLAMVKQHTRGFVTSKNMKHLKILPLSSVPEKVRKAGKKLIGNRSEYSL